MTTPDTLVLDEFNAHHLSINNFSWYSRLTDTRGRKIAEIINGFDYGILNCDSPTRVPPDAEPSSPDISLASLLKSWTKRQTRPSCGELLREFMAEENARQRMKQLHSIEVSSYPPSASHQVQPTVQYFKARQTHFFKRNPNSDDGTIGKGTNIHRGSSNEKQSRAVVRPLAPISSAYSI